MKYLNTNKSASYRRSCKTLELKNDPALIEEYKSVHSNDSFNISGNSLHQYSVGLMTT
jgi:hypothetical protein